MSQIWEDSVEAQTLRQTKSMRNPLREIDQNSINRARKEEDAASSKKTASDRKKSAFSKCTSDSCTTSFRPFSSAENSQTTAQSDQRGQLCAFRAPCRNRDSDCFIVSAASSETSTPQTSPCKEGGESELDTISLTIARLKGLGFSEMEVEWAVNEAKTRMQQSDGVTDAAADLTEQISELTLLDTCTAKDSKRATSLTGVILRRVLEMLETWTLIALTKDVNREWRHATTEALLNYSLPSDLAQQYVGARSLISPVTIAPDALQQHLPWGQYLAEGGFKRVYLCYNPAQNRREAVSVMDLAKMESNGNLIVADTEIRVGQLLSSLVERGICPHFVRSYQFLRCANAPPRCWGSETNKQPQGPLEAFLQKAAKGSRGVPRSASRKKKELAADLQYIRMEFCSGGDLEEALRAHPSPPLAVTWLLLHQMAASLHAAQEAFSMRHYDVKLLNFFLADPSPALDASASPIESEESFWRGPSGAGWVVKLADYGTVEVQTTTLGQPWRSHHVTTWENTPAEMLLFGDAAVQGYSPDVHALGLCLLHLLLGDAPYEEAVEDLRCPKALAKKVRKLWLEGEGYAEVAKLLEDSDDDALLEDTLYRNLVLFSTSQDLPGPGRRESSVLDAIKKYVNGAGKKQWRSDLDAYAVFLPGATKSDAIARAQQRMKSMDGSEALLKGMVDLVGDERVGVARVMEVCALQKASPYQWACQIDEPKHA